MLQTVPDYNTINLSEWGLTMENIRPKGSCPVCKRPFKRTAKGFICPKHFTKPTRFLVDFRHRGERVRRATTLDGKTLETLAQANHLFEKAKNEIREHTFDITRWKAKDRIDFRFERQIEDWYREKANLMDQGKCAPSYLRKLRSYIDRYFGYFNHQDVREIYNVKKFASNFKCSLKYQRNILSALHNFFAWLKENRHIKEIPVFPEIEVPEFKPTVIPLETRLKILEFVQDEHKPIFTFLFFQGCRPSEARALKNDCVERETETVTYRRTFSDHKLVERTKTRNIRVNWIFPEVMRVLPEKRFPLDFVFTHGKTLKRPYSKSFLQSLWEKALAEYNRRYKDRLKITLYEATKHSFGTEWVNKGVSLELLQKWFGHTNVKTTEKYAKLQVAGAFKAKVTEILLDKKASDKALGATDKYEPAKTASNKVLKGAVTKRSPSEKMGKNNYLKSRS